MALSKNRLKLIQKSIPKDISSCTFKCCCKKNYYTVNNANEMEMNIIFCIQNAYIQDIWCKKYMYTDKKKNKEKNDGHNFD